MARGRVRAPNKFTISNIDVEYILQQYYSSQIDDEIPETIIDNNSSFNNDMIFEKPKKSKKVFYFLDVYKSQIKINFGMYDFYSRSIMPQITNKPCWWCRNTFNSNPIGCPIGYNCHKSKGIEKERYDEKLSRYNIKNTEENDFFETEGVFCGFPCVKAYILDEMAKTKSSKYKEALSLLSLLHLKIYGTVVNIPRAHHWKCLNQQGGFLTQSEYYNSIGEIEYEILPNVCRPYMYSSAFYVKEKKLL